ncbi:hypothetical protein WA026_007936 [Henosepilachna vigintioctopunctata]|uniref:Uncharacterized protein n=1 Tax=Henosepilachna vigintioctopunctata TaxID=420089 RepID=A0AAW1TK55_9CUCU
MGLFCETGVEGGFSLFLREFYGMFDMAFPLQKLSVTRRYKNPWITRELLNQGAFVRELYRLSRSDNALIDRYKLVKQHTCNIVNAKKNFINNFISNSNNKSRAVWKCIGQNITLKKRVTIPDVIFDKNKKQVTDSSEKANSFNDFFINSVRELADGFPIPVCESLVLHGKVNNNTMFLTPVTPAEVVDTIQRVSKKRSCGLDGIPCNILVHIADDLSIPLTYLINMSFECGYFPSELKTALVTPVYKG